MMLLCRISEITLHLSYFVLNLWMAENINLSRDSQFSHLIYIIKSYETIVIYKILTILIQER